MTSHILLDEDSEHGLRCLHCYDIHSPALPMTVERHIDECRGFVLMHKHCQKPKDPQRQVELFDELAKREPDLPTALSFDGQGNGVIHYATSTNGGIDANRNDLPDPDTDPPNGYADTERERPEPPVDVFASMYPMPSSSTDLYLLLRSVVPVPGNIPLDLPWHPQSGVFDAVAHWARLEKAHAEAPKRAPIADMYIPARLPMPEALAEVLGVKGKKRGARPLSSERRVTK